MDALIGAVEANPKITVKTETVVARIAGEPGNFLVTLKKPGEKIEFDVPYPLPDEMKVDENGKELNAENLHKKYLEYNEGKKDILKFDPDGEKFGAVVLAAGWRPYKPKEGEFAHLGFGEHARRGHQPPVRGDRGQGQDHPAFGRQGGQIGGLCPEPGAGRRQRFSLHRRR